VSKHTDGPWEVGCMLDARAFDAESANILLITGRGYDIGYAAHLAKDGDTAEQEANAKLFATAPELLKSCEALLEELRLIREKDGPFVYDTTCRILARAAIAKARGEA
jgi:hypothetical protein